MPHAPSAAKPAEPRMTAATRPAKRVEPMTGTIHPDLPPTNPARVFAARRASTSVAQLRAEGAVAIARAARPALKRPVDARAGAGRARDVWRTPMQIDPFNVPLADKARAPARLWPLVKDVRAREVRDRGLSKRSASRSSSRRARARSSSRHQTRVWPSFSVTAVDGRGQFESRAAEIAADAGRLGVRRRGRP